MPENKEAREILEIQCGESDGMVTIYVEKGDLHSDNQCVDGFVCGKPNIDKILSALRTLLIEKMPKKMERIFGVNEIEAENYNKALDEVVQMIKEELR